MAVAVEERTASLEDRVTALELRSEKLEAKWSSIDLKLNMLLKDKSSMHEHYVHKDVYKTDISNLKKDINGVGERVSHLVRNLVIPPSSNTKGKWFKTHYQIVVIAVVCSVGVFFAMELMNWTR